MYITPAPRCHTVRTCTPPYELCYKVLRGSPTARCLPLNCTIQTTRLRKLNQSRTQVNTEPLKHPIS
ncbi:hypothetical protein XENTR_v10020307 [Xenopus tropicalis]|nr:hypothetical protein XENTR_v10020307 [Xenopus tropicalis]